ncbi:hypothetical protein C8J56DRAFT_979466 [Mycena floridula]|nr:hypothetical protein C8J56DRAFT_979466 [Mycena floridula]
MPVPTAKTAYQALMGRVRSRRKDPESHFESHFDLHSFPQIQNRPSRSRLLSLESFMSFGMGSDCNGTTMATIMCGNHSIKQRNCVRPGVFACSRCFLVQYCSQRCQKQHSQAHRSICFHPYLSEAWQPSWVTASRRPAFLAKNPDENNCLWGDVPAIDCLLVSNNEGSQARDMDLNICFIVSADINSLVSTVNGLPKDYSGRCKILMNDVDSIAVNRNLMILFALLRSGPSLDEAAELATHLMYSAALPAATATYWEECTSIYRKIEDGDMSFRASLAIRGGVKLHSMQTTMGVRHPLEMFQSTYSLRSALKSMRDVTLDPAALDNQDLFLSKLKPVHRLAFKKLQETGILVPFSSNTNNFTQPNRLLFTASGHWMPSNDANPLRGWDATEVQNSGRRRGVDSADIFGCLFFHVKDQLREFARRVKDMDIIIHLTQFDPRILSKGISSGVVPAFEGVLFDRVEASNLMDYVGVQECLSEWAPLLNTRNRYSCILMHSRYWHVNHPNATAQSNPRVMDALMKKCHHIPGLLQRIFAQGAQSPALFRLVKSLDAFYDHEEAFQFLCTQDADESAASCGLVLRKLHHIYPKRFGIPLDAPDTTRLPDLTKNEFYDLFTLGGAEFQLRARFLEFEVAR